MTINEDFLESTQMEIYEALGSYVPVLQMYGIDGRTFVAKWEKLFNAYFNLAQQMAVDKQWEAIAEDPTISAQEIVAMIERDVADRNHTSES